MENSLTFTCRMRLRKIKSKTIKNDLDFNSLSMDIVYSG